MSRHRGKPNRTTHASPRATLDTNSIQIQKSKFDNVN